MARSKNQTTRRNHLIQATLETIADRGLANLSLRSVAETAGISPRLVPYYYPDLETLVEAAHQAATERYYWSRRAALQDDANPTTKLARLMHTGLPREDDQLLSQVLDEMAVSASRSSVHSTLMTLLHEREVSLYVVVLEAGRVTGDFVVEEPTELIARNFVSLEDALGLHLLARNSSITLERAEQQLASFAKLATGAEVMPADLTSSDRDTRVRGTMSMVRRTSADGA